MSAKSAKSLPPRVLVTDNIDRSALPILQQTCQVVYEPSLTHDELMAKIGDVEGLMIRSASKITPDVLAQATHLKIVARAGVGTDNIDLQTATQKGVVVVNSPEGNTVAAAEHTVGMIFALARHIPEADYSLKQGEWKRSKLVGVELFGKTLGVIGFGKIGRRVATTCQAAGMKILVHDPFLSDKLAAELGVTLVSLDGIWQESDFITLHVPKNRQTLHLLNRNTLARCKKGVRIINCARGGVIDEEALAEAITSGHVAGAALDVFDSEPLAPDSPLLKLGSKVVLTPHLGASTEEAQINVAIDVAEQLRDFFQFGFARSAVNLPLLREDILGPVRAFMPLAETLGQILRQLTTTPVRSIEIIARGSLAQQTVSPLTLAVLKGLLADSREGVNYVNAPLLAEERGIEIKESTSKQSEGYLNLIELKLETQQGPLQIAGTLVADGLFQIVQLEGLRLSLIPGAHMLLTPHQDKPGMIAKVATILGQHHINVSALEVGRRALQPAGNPHNNESMMIFNLDSPVSDEILAEIRALEGIADARYVCLEG